MHNIDDETYVRVLTIRDTAGDTAEIGFTNDLGGRDGFGIKTDGGVIVRVQGEDLFAFRELLNELDESAFTRPKDPVEVDRWTPGDVVTFLNDYGTRFSLRRRHDGRWDKSVVRPGRLSQHVDESWGDLNVSRLVDHGDGFRDVEVLFQAVTA